MVTRRCSGRRLCLLPTEPLRLAFQKCLIDASKRFGVEVHALCVLSNHYHMIVTDTAAEPQLPKFVAAVNRELAKFLNVFYRREGAIWDSRKFSAVHLPTWAEVLDKIVYTLANPVEAGLVASPEDWPGLITLPSQLARKRYRSPCPRLYFRPAAPGTPRASLKLTKPPCLRDTSAEDYRRQVRTALKERLAQLNRARRRPVLGRAAVLTQDPFGQPTPKPPSRGLNPRLAHKGQDKWRRIELLQALKGFRQLYREAWKRWAAGFRDVLFPAGTYLMRELYGVRCVPPLPPD